MSTSISSAPPWLISMENQNLQQGCAMEQRESSTMRVISTCTAEKGILFIWTIFHLFILNILHFFDVNACGYREFLFHAIFHVS